MAKVVNLKTLNKDDFKTFLNSFDTIISDCDGVLYYLDYALKGAASFAKNMKENNKEFRYLSNNSTLTFENFQKKLCRLGFHANPEDIMFPTLAIVDYLTKINFTKSVYVLGLEAMKDELRKGGVKVADSGPTEIEEKFSVFKEQLQDNPEIGAVVIDIDINISYLKMTKALIYLKRPDVIFLAGASDCVIPISPTIKLMGPGLFLATLQEFSGKTATVLGKPSIYLKDLIIEKFKITNPERVLFIGDTLIQDISFASDCGFQSLLVLSGINTLEDVEKSTDNRMKPDYYISNLQDLNCIIETTS